ncbi:germination protein, Ger(x)C family [Paenibacillus sp. UNCCL117]|uniref:Ger(x)C family spore germination protein n=1 Tax=unclassified Paenibacillus TaxID=185978 RepID=UPI00087F8850|nr:MULTISPECIES: Ger(x)C family spore germination protein [unclassified Paenibacillus]SDD25862.1 germination protein, Ger(x)C family [Paenibacillus sp. cl123]SFW41193.1 germination protein, Ger(x)C family [Paenibacillus sp. UNCCL117]
MKRLLSGLCLLVLLPLTGCWNSSDVDDQDYVNAVGIEYRQKEKQYGVYLQLISFSKIAKDPAGGTQPSPVPAWIATGKGDTLLEAINQIYSMSERKLYWGHVTAMVLGEEMAGTQNLTEVLETFMRYYSLRYTMWTFCTREDMVKLFTASPNFEKSRLSTQLHSPDSHYEIISNVEPLRLNRFIQLYSGTRRTALLPCLSLSSRVWSKDDKPFTSMRVAGVYTFKEKRPHGYLALDKLQGLRWLEKNTTRALIGIMEEGKPLAAIRMHHPKVKILPSYKNGAMTYDVKVTVNGTINELKRFISEKELEEKAGQTIAAEIRRTFAYGVKIGADLYQLQVHGRPAIMLPGERGRAAAADEPLTEASLRDIQVKVHIVSGGKYKIYSER